MTNKRALIVRDEVEACLILENLLVQKGIVPERACNAIEALGKAEERRYSFYFIDANFAESSGFEVAEQIKKIQPDAIIILMYCSPGDTLKAAKVGFLSHVRKPYDLDKLLLFT